MDLGLSRLYRNIFSHQHYQTKKEKERMEVLERGSALLLGGFAAYTKISWFAPVFLAGATIAACNLGDHKHRFRHLHGHSGCSHGVLEKITGVTLPAPVSLAVAVAEMLAHVEHQAIFVAIVALIIGAWVGENAAHAGTLASKKIRKLVS